MVFPWLPSPLACQRKDPPMQQFEHQEVADYLFNSLRLRTVPLAVKFLEHSEFPEKTKKPSLHLGHRVTLCQGVTLARVYGWMVGLAKEDLICVPAMVAFGFSGTGKQQEILSRILCGGTLASGEETAKLEIGAMSLFPRGTYASVLLSPLAKAPFAPDIVTMYGNPAQIMRLVQAWTYATGHRVEGNFGGKIECTEYLIAPFLNRRPRVAIPGNGDRIFSMTQDDEIVFSLPGEGLSPLVQGLKEAGRKIGARYPITFYQKFQPEFPSLYGVVSKEFNVLD